MSKADHDAAVGDVGSPKMALLYDAAEKGGLVIYAASGDERVRCTEKFVIEADVADALVSAIDDSSSRSDLVRRMDYREGHVASWMPLSEFVECAQSSYAAAQLAAFVAACRSSGGSCVCIKAMAKVVRSAS